MLLRKRKAAAPLTPILETLPRRGQGARDTAVAKGTPLKIRLAAPI